MYTVFFAAFLVSLLTLFGGMAIAYLFPHHHFHD